MAVIFEQKKFDKGEVSPSFYGRSDLETYKGAVSKLENAIVTEVGSIQKRPGFTRVASLGATPYVLIPFQFNIEQSYVVALSITDLKIYSETTLVATITPSPFARIGEIKYAQSGDTLYLVHRGVFPKRLIRRGHTDWVLEDDIENFWNYEVVPLSWTRGEAVTAVDPSLATGLRFDPPSQDIRVDARENNITIMIKLIIDSAHTSDIVVAVTSDVEGAQGSHTITTGMTEVEFPVEVDLPGERTQVNTISGSVTSGGVSNPSDVMYTIKAIPQMGDGSGR